MRSKRLPQADLTETYADCRTRAYAISVIITKDVAEIWDNYSSDGVVVNFYHDPLPLAICRLLLKLSLCLITLNHYSLTNLEPYHGLWQPKCLIFCSLLGADYVQGHINLVWVLSFLRVLVFLVPYL